MIRNLVPVRLVLCLDRVIKPSYPLQGFGYRISSIKETELIEDVCERERMSVA